MTVLTEQESSWINEMATRLRLIQADAAQADPENRLEFLQEEVERGLKSVPPANRKRYLEALLARFPIAGNIPKPAPPTAIPAPPPIPLSTEEMLERFVAAAAGSSQEKRTEAAKRLFDAGLVWVDRDALVLEISDGLRQSLGLPAGQQPRLKRLVELTALLVEMFYRLNETALATLRELSPNSPHLKRLQDFRGMAARFLVEESESREPQMRRLCGFPASLLAAIKGDEKRKGTGSAFVNQYKERFSPAAIEEVVKSEDKFGIGPFSSSKKECCWEKYEVLAEDFANPGLMERWIKDCLGKVVDDYLKKLEEKKVPGER